MASQRDKEEEISDEDDSLFSADDDDGREEFEDEQSGDEEEEEEDEPISVNDEDNHNNNPPMDESRPTAAGNNQQNAPKVGKKKKKPGTLEGSKQKEEEDYFQLEHKLRQQRLAKRMVPAERILGGEEGQRERERMRWERNNPKIALHGRPPTKRQSGSVFTDADFEAIGGRNKGQQKAMGIGKRVKRIR